MTVPTSAGIQSIPIFFFNQFVHFWILETSSSKKIQNSKLFGDSMGRSRLFDYTSRRRSSRRRKTFSKRRPGGLVLEGTMTVAQLYDRTGTYLGFDAGTFTIGIGDDSDWALHVNDDTAISDLGINRKSNLYYRQGQAPPYLSFTCDYCLICMPADMCTPVISDTGVNYCSRYCQELKNALN